MARLVSFGCFENNHVSVLKVVYLRGGFTLRRRYTGLCTPYHTQGGIPDYVHPPYHPVYASSTPLVGVHYPPYASQYT